MLLRNMRKANKIETRRYELNVHENSIKIHGICLPVDGSNKLLRVGSNPDIVKLMVLGRKSRIIRYSIYDLKITLYPNPLKKPYTKKKEKVSERVYPIS